MKISVIIVSWNSGDDLLLCLESLARAKSATRVEVETIVVDNGSDTFPSDRMKEILANVRLEILGRNIGFGPACNHGARLATGEILFFLNPDTEAVGDPFAPLAQAFESHRDWVAVAPRLIEADQPLPGEPQEEFQLRRFPTLVSLFRELFLIDRAFPRNSWRRRDRYLDRDRRVSFDVEQPAAAALAVRRTVFDAAGGFDPRFVPAWWEDVDLCRRLVRLGKVVYLPESSFRHAGGVSATRLGYDAFLPLYYRHALLYFRKHRGEGAVFALRLYLVAGMLMRLTLLPWRSGDPRPKTVSSRAYRRTLGVALEGR